MTHYPKTYEKILALKNVPVVVIDQEGTFTYINAVFTKEYGWTEDDLLQASVTKIMPEHMRNAHTVGFARYLATETSELLGKALPLSIRYKDGRVRTSMHYIMGKKVEGVWQFAAIIDFPEEDE